MSENQTLTWERIDGFPLNGHSQNPAYVYRAAVPGGWLIGMGEVVYDSGVGGLTFVPDPQHTWKGGSVDRG